MQARGKLTVYFGCMFAGKTTTLIRRIDKLKLGQENFIIVKPAVDTRAGIPAIVTHEGISRNCHLYLDKGDIDRLISPRILVVAIDEIQFFHGHFIGEIESLLLKGIHVIASGLDKDFMGRPFGLMPDLIKMADELHHLKAKCNICGKDAEYTFRKSESRDLVEIGNSAQYEARCRVCFEKNLR